MAVQAYCQRYQRGVDELEPQVALDDVIDTMIVGPGFLDNKLQNAFSHYTTCETQHTDGQQVDVYAVNGMKVSTVTINNGRIDLSHLPKGVYIVEGKKVVKD